MRKLYLDLKEYVGLLIRMKDVELNLISELMKNCRRSDRELANCMGVSQPTVTRLRTRLEREGKIQEYAMIPNFGRLGYQILAVTFVGKQKIENEEEKSKLMEAIIRMEKEAPLATLMVANGVDLEKGRVIINLFKDYSSYIEGMRMIKSLPYMDSCKMESFLVDLNESRNSQVLSLAQTARHLTASGEAMKPES